jgi:cell division protein FtsL
MNTTIPTNWIILLGILAVVLLAVAIGFISQRQRQSKRLRQRFGAEYDRAVTEFGRNKAEAELKAREKRVEKLTIIPLAPADAARFTQAWTALQGRFIDNPKGVVVEADHLVRELMLKRGYPMGDFEMRAADISVDHPAVVENYRAAQAIAVRDERGEADTEELRKAVVHYRTLFDELLGERPAKRVESPAGQIPVHT